MYIRLKPITWAGYFIFANHIILQYLMKYLTVGHYEIQGTGQSTTLHPESKLCNPTRSLSWYPGSKTIQHRIQNRTPWVKGQRHCTVLALWSYKIQSLCPLWEWLLLTNQLFNLLNIDEILYRIQLHCEVLFYLMLRVYFLKSYQTSTCFPGLIFWHVNKAVSIVWTLVEKYFMQHHHENGIIITPIVLGGKITVHIVLHTG